jgi:hypothetical protein
MAVSSLRNITTHLAVLSQYLCQWYLVTLRTLPFYTVIVVFFSRTLSLQFLASPWDNNCPCHIVWPLSRCTTLWSLSISLYLSFQLHHNKKYLFCNISVELHNICSLKIFVQSYSLIYKNYFLKHIPKLVLKISLHNNRIRGRKGLMEVQVLVWFTDGCGTEKGTETGIYGPKTRILFSLSKYTY